MFSLIAWYKSAAANGLTALSTITDTSITPVGSAGTQYAIPKEMPYLMGAYVGSAHAARAKITSPSILQLSEYFIEPADAAANPSTFPPWTDSFDNPVYIVPGDAMSFLADNVNNNEATFGLAWIGDGNYTNAYKKGVPGDPGTIPCEATASITSVAGAWAAGPLTFTDPLQAGTYSIRGMQAHFGSGMAARLIPPVGSIQRRPGVLASSTAATVMPLRFRAGRAGEFLQFDSETPPQVEILATAATSSQRFVFDIARIATP